MSRPASAPGRAMASPECPGDAMVRRWPGRTLAIQRSGAALAQAPEGSCTLWCERPHRCQGHGARPPPVFLAFCAVVLVVAAVAAPLPSSVTVTGSVRPKPWQLRLVNDMARRFAMKVNRLLPTPGTGEASVASTPWSLDRNLACTLTMFWQ